MPQSAFAAEGQDQQDQAADVQQAAAAADDQVGAGQVEGALPDQADDQAAEGEDADASDPDQEASAEDSDPDVDSVADGDSADAEDTASDAIDESVADSVKDTVANVGTGLVDDDPLPSNTSQSDSMKYCSSYNGFDIQGIDGSGNAIQTTRSNKGYLGAIKVNGLQQETGISQLGKVYTFEGVQVKLNITIAPNGESVYYTYTLYNTNADAATIQIGNSSDVQIGDNDNAAVTISGGGKKISMVNDDTSSSTYGMKYTLCADPDGEAFTGVWAGYWLEHGDNVFTTLDDRSYTGGDSGLAFHWDFSLASGEMATRTAVFNISPALKVTDVTLTADASIGKLNMTIPFTDGENRTQTLYYTLQDADEQTAATSTGEGVESGEFDVNTDVPASWTAGHTYTVTLYVKDSMGYTSKTYTYYVYWPGSDDPTKTYSTLSFENTSTAFAHVRDVQGTVITLPTDPGKPDGKRFLKWNTSLDGGGTDYAAGASYTLAADATLYAQWAYSLEDAVISAIADQVYDGTAKTPGAVVTLYGNVLTEGTDYEVDYTDNVHVGVAAAVFKGIGSVIGHVTTGFMINRADLTDISVVQTDSHTYDAEAYTASVSASATAKGGQPVTFKYYTDGRTAASETIPTFTDAGSHTVCYIASAPNHYDAYGHFQIVISPKEATVTANDASKVYGDVDPDFTATVSGTLGTDTVDYSFTRGVGENVGTYAIAPTGDASQGNYTVVFNDGFLTITQKSITVNADNKAKTYGDADPELTAVVRGLVGSDTIDYALSRMPGEDVGMYLIYASGESSQGNYTVRFNHAGLRIDPRPVTVTADDKSKFYGEADPELTVTVEGALDGDTVEYGIERDPGEYVGAYAIRVWSNAIVASSDQAVQGNYDVTFVDGAFTIEPDPATWFEIRAEGGEELTYNGSEQGPAFTVTCDGKTLVEGADYTVSGTTATKIGSYAAGFTGIGNYAGTAEVSWSIVAPAHVDDYQGTKETPENNEALDETYDTIVNEVSETEKVPSNVKETTEGAVKAAIADGEAFIVEVRAIQVSKQDESGVPAADKNLVAIAVQSLASEGVPEMVEYLDISVLLKNARTDEILAYITQTDSPIYFAIKLDADIASQLAGKAVYLVRTHDGESAFIDAVLGEDGVLKFSSDLFSTYAIASVETAEPEPEPDNGIGNGNGAQSCAQAASCSDGSASPKTGDSLPTALIAGIALAAFAALAAASRKRAER